MVTSAPDKSISFKDTLNLPTTSFPITPHHTVDDPAMLNRWQQEDLFTRSFYAHEGNEKFIINDGPPYTNGPIHLGHAYNKITKDIMCKAQRMQGKQVPIIPVWDCHGLPIERKVSEEQPELSPAQLKKACREYAQKWVNVQREQFKALGVLMNWDKPYLTMDPAYEASVIRALAQFVKEGYIQKKKKTVPWCPTDQTVLATAEIEYKDQKDPSTYVLFSLTPESTLKLTPKLANSKIHAVVWTTTPWTLPLNRAVLIKPGAVYDILAYKENEYLMVASERSDFLTNLLGISKEIISQASSADLAGLQTIHPFLERTSPIIADDSVSLDDGTAFVHSAPGCGPEDYEVALRHDLEIYSPISSDGKYTRGIEPQELEGMSVKDGQIWVLRKLTERHTLLLKKMLTHAYPHCWRCHNPLIFRATEQWFCDLSHEGLRQRALDAIEHINFLPPNSKNFLKATISGRLEWCLSRQRVWGVPIPALVCNDCLWVYTSSDFMNYVADQVARHGIEYWDTVSLKDLGVLDLKCSQCNGNNFSKEKDILDVWFDAGLSHYALLYNNPELKFPADMYLEGLDQHRGFFQSSLLTGLVVEKQAPMKAILTHGFVVDEKGHKMSKSLGNVVSPEEIIKQLGTDGLRLWVASIDYGGDAIVSKTLLANVGQVYRKIRNTCRFLLANLYDFSYEYNAITVDKMLLIDRYALHELTVINNLIQQAYAQSNFTGVYHALTDYCTVNLSAHYLDIIKDRLYTDAATSHERRSAQTACYIILDTLTRLCAPILSFLSEQVSDLYQSHKHESIHLQTFNSLSEVQRTLQRSRNLTQGRNTPLEAYHLKSSIESLQERVETQALTDQLQQEWKLLLHIRSAVLKAIEELRVQGIIKHSLEAKLTMALNLSSDQQQLFNALLNDVGRTGQTIEQFFREFFIVSQVELASVSTHLSSSTIPELNIRVEKAEGIKCPRCWQWTITNHPHGLCNRCFSIVSSNL